MFNHIYTIYYSENHTRQYIQVFILIIFQHIIINNISFLISWYNKYT